DIDRQYFLKLHGPDLHDCSRDVVPPPQLYWWWPYRLNGSEQRCDFDWGLRDSNLSPDFPTNARAAMQIVQQSGIVPGNRPLQGVIAFTPVLIEGLLASDVFGPGHVPEFKAVVDAAHVEHIIHENQLGGRKPSTGDRKAFIRSLAAVLLGKLKDAHGDQLNKVLGVVEKALQTKELEIYLADPRAELVLS